MQIHTTVFATLAATLLLTTSAFGADYTVKRGDTLYEIARANGVSVRSIVDANSIQNPDLIFPGQVLQIPGNRVVPPATRPPVNRPPVTRPSETAPANRPSTTPAARPQSATRTRVYKLGGNKLGGFLTRKTSSEWSTTSAAFETETKAEVSVLNRKLRVFRLQRGVEGRNLTTAPRIDRSFQLEVLGQSRITIGKSLTRSFYVTAFRVPVPVGPIVLDVKTSVGSTMDVGASFPLAWSSRTGYGLTLYGSSGLGGKVSLERSIVIANAGIEGRCDLINASLPAATQLKLSGVDFDVSLMLSSHVSISAFAEAGIGPFKKRFRVGIPFMSWTFARKTIPILHGSIGLGARR